MKILQVIPYFCFGGAETMCENLSLALTKAGHQVTVVSLYGERTPISQRVEAAGIPVIYLDKKPGLDLRMVPRLKRIMAQLHPDAVHTHLDVIKYAALAARLAGVRRCVHTVHNVADQESGGRVQKCINTVYFRRGLSVPVALSPLVQQTVVDYYGLPTERVPVIFNGIDLTHCRVKTDYHLGEEVRLLHIGRFNEQKNHAGLLRAFRLLHDRDPRVRLELLGEGELLEPMQALARELNIEDYVCFRGAQRDVYPYLQAADLFLLPSHYEGMPMTLIEAMGTGLPIVAAPVGGVPDMLTNEQSALLTDPWPEQVAEACLRLLADESLRQRLGREALASVSRFCADHMAREYCRVYENGTKKDGTGWIRSVW